MEVCKVFLIEGLPFNILDEWKNHSWRELLERDHFVLGKQKIAHLIPTLLEEELKRVLMECNNLMVAEVINIVVRFVTPKEKNTQRLFTSKFLSKSSSGDEFARTLHKMMLWNVYLARRIFMH